MSAPGSLACSKILFPETEESALKDVSDLELPEVIVIRIGKRINGGSLRVRNQLLLNVFPMELYQQLN